MFKVVRNTYELPRSKRHKMYAKLGYAVVAFDNRGSAGRSLDFQVSLFFTEKWKRKKNLKIWKK